MLHSRRLCLLACNLLFRFGRFFIIFPSAAALQVEKLAHAHVCFIVFDVIFVLSCLVRWETLRADEEALAKLDHTKIGVLAGSGMGGLTVFQDGVKALVEKGPKKITPFFIPYAITNVGATGCFLLVTWTILGVINWR